MPNYIYKHPETGEIKEVIQRMTEPHVYYSQNGVQWERVFESPNAQVDTLSNIDPFNKNDFVKRTAKSGMKLGDMFDESARLSEKRAKIEGKDPVKEKAESHYKDLTGKPHPMADRPKSKYFDVT